MTTILLTGVTGQVGWELQRTLMPLGRVIACDRQLLDLTNPDSIRTVIQEIKPQIIVNPAAYTAVDKAESEPELAQAINAIAPGVMAEEARKIGAVLIHYSTDYVFDGTTSQALTEDDPTNPLGVYGKTKLEGEQAIQSVGGSHLILRTSWIYSRMGKNFLLTMLRLARERQELKVVDDQVGAPTWSRLIAEVTAQILTQGREDIYDFLSDRGGIYHLSSAGQTSWYGFAKAILDLDPQPNAQIVEQLLPITTAEYPTPARRPAYSLLDNSKLSREFKFHFPTWQEVLKLAIAT